MIFAYHGYPWLIHRLTYRRANHDNIHVRGYKEEGTTTTPFDMVMLNEMDRYHLVMDVIDRVPGLGPGRRACARRWSTSACATARTPARPATTRPRSRDWVLARLRVQRVLVVNAGSSSLKLRLLDPDDEVVWTRDLDAGADELEDALAEAGAADASGHRIVHGGPGLTRPGRVDDALVADLRALTELAPLHQPPRSTRSTRSAAPARRPCGRVLRHGVPRDAAGGGAHVRASRASGASGTALRRYGFHGLSHAYASRRAAELVGGARAAPRDLPPRRRGVARRGARRPLGGHDDGLHAARGLVMATRSGRRGPGAAAWLRERGGMAPRS